MRNAQIAKNCLRERESVCVCVCLCEISRSATGCLKKATKIMNTTHQMPVQMACHDHLLPCSSPHLQKHLPLLILALLQQHMSHRMTRPRRIRTQTQRGKRHFSSLRKMVLFLQGKGVDGEQIAKLSLRCCWLWFECQR